MGKGDLTGRELVASAFFLFKTVFIPWLVGFIFGFAGSLLLQAGFSLQMSERQVLLLWITGSRARGLQQLRYPG